MANKNFSFVVLVFMLAALTSASARPLDFNIEAAVGFNITGRVVCGTNDNLLFGLFGQPLPGITVTISCDGGRTAIARAATNNLGVFLLNVDSTKINLLNLGRCSVLVPLPVRACCTVLPRTGFLRVPIIPISIGQGPLGLVVGAFTGIFQYVKRL